MGTRYWVVGIPQMYLLVVINSYYTCAEEAKLKREATTGGTGMLQVSQSLDTNSRTFANNW